MNKRIYNAFLCFVMMLLCWQAHAQTSVKGRVEDATGPLQGATWKLLETNMSGATGLDGQFSFRMDLRGKQQVSLSYIGFEEKVITLDADSSADIDLGVIRLLPTSSSALEGVVVTGVYRPSQARALQMKKSSGFIVETLAADAIGKLPDRNAAEAVQRIQGVSIERDLGEGRSVSVRGTPIQWSSSTLNGNRLPSASGDNANRGLQMDIFPSEIIQFVKLAKAITPDMDGDAIGGSIDFITRTAPARETFTLNGSAGYVDQSHKMSYNGSFVYGNKITDKLAFMATGVIWDRSAAGDNYLTMFDFNNPDPKQSFAINQFQLRDYVARRKTIGFNGALQFNPSPNHKFSLRGLYSQYLDQQTVRESYFTFQNKTTSLQARHADYLTDLFNIQLSGHSKFSDRLSLDWSGYVARSSFQFNSPKNNKKEDRGYPILNFVQPTEFNNLAEDGKRYQAMDWKSGNLKEDHVHPSLVNNLDPNLMRLNQIILAQNRNHEIDRVFKADLSYKVHDRFTVKAGFKGLHKTKDLMSKVLVWMPNSVLGVPNAKVTMLSELETERFPFNGGFLSEIGSPYDNVLIDQVTNQQIDKFFTDDARKTYALTQVQGDKTPSNVAGKYDGKENIYAGYIMGNWDVSDRLLLIGGVRYEYNHIAFNGSKITTETEGVKQEPINDINRYPILLPMLHAKWSISEEAILRAALTRSFARPDFNYLNPGTIINDLNNTIIEGNIALKPTISNNADLMFEYYFSDVGLLSAGVYYKDLRNIIYNNESLVTVDNKNYIKASPSNLEKASLLGFEVGLSKRFTELSGLLSKLGVEANYSFVDSKVDMPQFEKGVQVSVLKTTLPKQAKHIFNTILFYEDGKVMARVAGNYKGNYLNAIRSQAGASHYQWFDKNFTMDFSASYAVTPKVRLFMELNNITNEPNRFYHGDRARTEMISYAGFRGQMGVSLTIK